MIDETNSEPVKATIALSYDEFAALQKENRELRKLAREYIESVEGFFHKRAKWDQTKLTSDWRAMDLASSKISEATCKLRPLLEKNP